MPGCNYLLKVTFLAVCETNNNDGITWNKKDHQRMEKRVKRGLLYTECYTLTAKAANSQL